MKPPIETIRLSQKAKDQLVEIKKQTGIENWNILCRWAFCLSLNEATEPSFVSPNSLSEVEINWKVFAGVNSYIYISVFKQRWGSLQMKNDIDDYFLSHLNRGVGLLLLQKDIYLMIS